MGAVSKAWAIDHLNNSKIGHLASKRIRHMADAHRANLFV
jgi:hypothetical protein